MDTWRKTLDIACFNHISKCSEATECWPAKSLLRHCATIEYCAKIPKKKAPPDVTTRPTMRPAFQTSRQQTRPTQNQTLFRHSFHTRAMCGFSPRVSFHYGWALRAHLQHIQPKRRAVRIVPECPPHPPPPSQHSIITTNQSQHTEYKSGADPTRRELCRAKRTLTTK